MELIVSFKTEEELNSLLEYSNYFCIGCINYSPAFTYPVDKYLFVKYINKLLENNKKIIIRLDIFLHEHKIEFYKSFINEFIHDNIYYYVTDLSFIVLFEKLGLKNKVIYDPQTMITNYLDSMVYDNLNLFSYALSLEIPYKDVLETNTKNQIYLGFGKRMMFYSLRQVLTSYTTYDNIKIDKSKKHFLKEQTRFEFYPIFEDEFGTYIFRSYFVSNIDVLEKDTFKLLIISNIDISFDKYIKVVKIYSEFINGLKDKDECIRDIRILNLDIKDGFKYKDSVYQKEDNNE